MDSMIAKLVEVDEAAADTREAIATMGLAADNSAETVGRLDDVLDDLYIAAGGATRELGSLREAMDQAGEAASTVAAAGITGLDGKLDDLVMLSTAAVSELHDLRDALAGVAFTAMAAAGSLAAAGGAANDAGGTARRTYGWWRLSGNALHWLVMGTLEIAATAIPAIVALGAAVAGMYETWGHVYDVMTNLYTASGSLHNAFLNSVGPLRALGEAGDQLQAAMAPDVYIIFGSLIDSLTSHMGAFRDIAEQAGNVLAGFATKLSDELAGGGGQAVASFFTDSVRDMIEWGQVLGNLGHAFVNIMGSMFGVSKVLLGVLDLLSRALLALTSNPVIGFMIGLAAAMSAAYRYGKLLVTIWTWLGGTAAVTAIKGMVTLFAGLVTELGFADAAVLSFYGILGTVTEFMTGPLGIAIGVIGAGLAIWYLATRDTSDATSKLIQHVEALPPTVDNLTKGIGLLNGNLTSLVAQQDKVGAAFQKAVEQGGKFADMAATLKQPQIASDISKTVQAIQKEASELIQLQMGLAQTGLRTGEVGAGMDALQIQTAIADSKITSLNQALDAYVAELTGGTQAESGFVEAMAGLTSGTNNITSILGASGSATLSVKDFAHALTTMSSTGAAAWQNFNGVFTGSMEPLVDWLRTATVTGDATGKSVTQATLDMSKAMIPFAADSKSAQAELLGFARAQGINVKSFPQLEQMVKDSGAGMDNLKGIVNGTTIALSDLSQAAQNTANALSSQESAAMAQAALSAQHYQTKVTALVKAIQEYGSNSPQAVAAAHAVAHAQDVAGQSAINAANDAQKAAGRIAAAAHLGAGAIKAEENAARQLQQFLNSMHGTTVNVDVNYAQTGAAPHYGNIRGIGQGGAAGGWVHGGGTSTSDSVPAWLSHGEFVVNAAAAQRHGALLEAINTRRLAAGGPATTVSAGGGVSVSQTLNLNVTVELDGKQLGDRVRTSTLIYNRRNNSANLRLRAR
jgi:hypothetical protein